MKKPFLPLIRLFVFFSVGLAMSTRAIGADKPESFLRDSNVVILTGLAGDLESERSYTDQLQSLFTALALPANRPKMVFLLSDLDVHPPAGLTVEKTPAKREEFLALGAKLQGQPLAVFAWGHAGPQGDKFVFHVRGPRLTADDFRALADQQSGAASRWVLLFRGSGGFARALQKEGRQILSSENDAVFESDPHAMELAPKLLLGAPAFRAFADRLGQVIAPWYESRHLSRTEEPAFWDGAAAEPALVAQTASAPAASSSPAADDGSAAAASAELPAAWQGIARLSAEQFPEADAVTLRQRIGYTLADSPAITQEQEQFIQILTSEGKSEGDFDVSYSPPEESIEFTACEVLLPDGKTLVKLDPDKIHNATEGEKLGDYAGPTRKIFSLPQVGVGAILHIGYRKTFRNFPLPSISLEIPLATELPTRDAAVEVRVSRKLPFHFAIRGLAAAPDPQTQQGEYGTSYRWAFAELPAFRPEPLVSPHGAPALLVSTFADWEAFAGWYRRLIKLADTVTPEITATARAVTLGASNEREKAQRLYDFVTNLRYVAVPLGVNSFRPHAAASVLANRFGDCKDKANLYNTLLRAVGIYSDLVLVPRGMQVDEAAPGLAFNHAISRVHLGNDTIWADTTDDICRFGFLPPGDPGRRVLVVGGDAQGAKRLATLPTAPAESNRLTLKVTLRLGDNPAAPAEATLEADSAGYADYQLRAAARAAASYKSAIPILTELFRAGAGALELVKQEKTSIAALDQPFRVTARGRFDGLVSGLPDGRTAALHFPFYLPKEWEIALQPRQRPLYLNAGYPFVLEQETAFELPAGAGDLRLPQASENSQGPLRWKLAWAKKSDTALVATLRLELNAAELDAAGTGQFQEALRQWMEASFRPATFTFAAK